MADLVPILRITDDDPLKMAAADEIERLRAALLRCRGMVGHPDNIAYIDAALANEQTTKETDQ